MTFGKVFTFSGLCLLLWKVGENVPRAPKYNWKTVLQPPPPHHTHAILQWNRNENIANTQLPLWPPPISLLVLEQLGSKGLFFLMSNPNSSFLKQTCYRKTGKVPRGQWSTLEIWALKINRSMTTWPFVSLAVCPHMLLRASVSMCACVPVCVWWSVQVHTGVWVNRSLSHRGQPLLAGFVFLLVAMTTARASVSVNKAACVTEPGGGVWS